MLDPCVKILSLFYHYSICWKQKTISNGFAM